jgi:hypothetical protein
MEYTSQDGHTPLRGSEHIGRHWRKVAGLIGAKWRVEHAIACDDEVAIEWSMEWTAPHDGERYIVHGAEFYAFRGELISEIRGYYSHGEARDTGLVGFPYAERGYTTIAR